MGFQRTALWRPHLLWVLELYFISPLIGVFVAPIFGGYIVVYYSWRVSFYIMVFAHFLLFLSMIKILPSNEDFMIKRRLSVPKPRHFILPYNSLLVLKDINILLITCSISVAFISSNFFLFILTNTMINKYHIDSTLVCEALSNLPPHSINQPKSNFHLYYAFLC